MKTCKPGCGLELGSRCWRLCVKYSFVNIARARVQLLTFCLRRCEKCVRLVCRYQRDYSCRSLSTSLVAASSRIQRTPLRFPSMLCLGQHRRKQTSSLQQQPWDAAARNAPSYSYRLLSSRTGPEPVWVHRIHPKLPQ